MLSPLSHITKKLPLKILFLPIFFSNISEWDLLLASSYAGSASIACNSARVLSWLSFPHESPITYKIKILPSKGTIHYASVSFCFRRQSDSRYFFCRMIGLISGGASSMWCWEERTQCEANVPKFLYHLKKGIILADITSRTALILEHSTLMFREESSIFHEAIYEIAKAIALQANHSCRLIHCRSTTGVCISFHLRSDREYQESPFSEPETAILSTSV